MKTDYTLKYGPGSCSCQGWDAGWCKTYVKLEYKEVLTTGTPGEKNIKFNGEYVKSVFPGPEAYAWLKTVCKCYNGETHQETECVLSAPEEMITLWADHYLCEDC